MSATIDGVKWTATSVSGTYSPATNNVGASILTIVGTDVTQSVGIGIGNGKVGTALTTGTYDIPAINTATGNLSIGLALNAYTAAFTVPGSSGFITLSTFNTSTKKASGTFTLVVVGAGSAKKNITDGTFSVTYK